MRAVFVLDRLRTDALAANPQPGSIIYLVSVGQTREKECAVETLDRHCTVPALGS